MEARHTDNSNRGVFAPPWQVCDETEKTKENSRDQKSAFIYSVNIRNIKHRPRRQLRKS